MEEFSLPTIHEEGTRTIYIEMVYWLFWLSGCHFLLISVSSKMKKQFNCTVDHFELEGLQTIWRIIISGSSNGIKQYI